MRPEQIRSWLDANLHRFDQPNQFLGSEPNAMRRSWDDSSQRWCLVASWPYFHAAGNQSIPAVYNAVHSAGESYLADRFYLPETPRDLRTLERGGIPAFGIESGHPIADFDVVGTSISYVVLLMNFRKMLDMSGIPPRRTDREGSPGDYPMVLVGGQSYCAPEPLAVVADAIWCGEVEDEPGNGGIGLVLSRIGQFKDEGRWSSDRTGCYQELAREFNYLYFPAFVETSYATYARPECGDRPSKQVSGYRSSLPGMRMPFTKRFVHDLDAAQPLEAPPLLFADPAMGAGDIETSRGCPAWCSFCRLTFAQKPFRQRSVEATVASAARFQANVGSVELSPFGPDFPMQTNKKRLIASLLQNVNSDVDATAMRIDDFTADPSFIHLQALGGMDSATLGLEGNSQRMRDLVGKGVSDSEVERAVIEGIRAGLRKFKLFMITNLPGEDEGDVMRIVRLAERLAEIRDSTGPAGKGIRIQFSWTPLLIEANTPFQWFAPTPPDHTLIKVSDAFRRMKIDFKIGTKAEPNKVAFFQLCQRASREVAEAIFDALDDVNTATWGGVPRDLRERLEAALAARGFANGFGDCFDERGESDLFGWEFIDTGVAGKLLWETFVRMREFAVNTESETYDSQFEEHYHGQEWLARCDESCMGNTCGVCSKPDLQARQSYIAEAEHEAEVDVPAVRPVDQSTVAMRVRARLERPERYATVPASHWRYAVRRALYRAAQELAGTLPAGTGVAKRTVAFASDTMAVRDWVAGADYADFGLTRSLSPGQLSSLMGVVRTELAEWLEVRDFVPYPAASGLRGATGDALYRLPLDADPDAVGARLAWWAGQERIDLTLRTDSAYFGLGSEVVNARDYVSDMWLVRAGAGLELRLLASGRPGPYLLTSTLLGKAGWIDLAARRARRVEVFGVSDGGSLLSAVCEDCGEAIPLTLTGSPFSLERCARCADERAGIVVAGLPRPLPV